MKKLLKTALVVLLCIVSLMPMKSFAADGEKVQWQDIDLPEAEIQRILALNPQDNTSSRATDLILTYNVGVAKDGTTLLLVAKMVCTGSVVKCGFKNITVQRRATTSSSWSDYLVFKENYVDSYSHITAKQITVQAGYQYRAVCTFYAKKSLLVTQKIEVASNLASFW